MIDTKKLQELDQEYDQNLRNIYRNREQLEDDFHLFMARTDSLKESVYQATLGQGWELPQEALHTYIIWMIIRIHSYQNSMNIWKSLKKRK